LLAVELRDAFDVAAARRRFPVARALPGDRAVAALLGERALVERAAYGAARGVAGIATLRLSAMRALPSSG
jgi:hypothetical protein